MTIVAAVDRSERAATVAREAAVLGRAFDEPVHVVHVMTRSAFVDLERSSVEDTGDPVGIDDVREIAAESAAKAVEGLEGSFTTIGLMGEPSERIVEYATEVDARYVVVSPRRRSPAGKAVFGSVGQSVLLNAECPVVTSVEH